MVARSATEAPAPDLGPPPREVLLQRAFMDGSMPSRLGRLSPPQYPEMHCRDGLHMAAHPGEPVVGRRRPTLRTPEGEVSRGDNLRCDRQPSRATGAVEKPGAPRVA